MANGENSTIESTLKSMDTEEPIDLVFYRPIGYGWALLFRKLGVHPNTVTIASIVIGVAAGVFFYFDSLYYNIIGMLLLIWANSYDSADGQLARLTGQKTQIGRALDGIAGDFWFASIYIAICLRLMPDWSYYIWLMAALAGLCHSKQAAMADYYRNVHLFFLKGKAGSELDNSVQEQESYNALPWKGNFVAKVYHFLYARYTAGQEKQSPKFQAFFMYVRQCYGENIPKSLADEFRAASKPLMKYTNILSFNTRVLVLFIGLFVQMPWIYFIFELTILNGLLIYMIYKHEALSKRLHNQLKESNPSEE
ncbi:CDP-alcohol phosphatidyltransferase family protein [Bacteroides sp. 214]|uniref:CDP-alcohol phosphatidyltransferase family protein n=1 Tax=Bacteroides sp. 214 TaxID=2302935 RepID=UPI0013D546D7|nr:CDP-alcohol phosphatidyltransferase family protein [Bacteroides sp. 214]NDW12431.1 CDP-alcohol phosphatidyltransferase family protein [Bacteroides sp. 214]